MFSNTTFTIEKQVAVKYKNKKQKKKYYTDASLSKTNEPFQLLEKECKSIILGLSDVSA